MAPRITKEDVFEAAECLFMQGVEPTNRAVRDQIGSGSNTTVNQHLRAWWRSREKSHDRFSQELNDAIALELNQVAAQARAEVEADCRRLSRELDQVVGHADAVEQERERLKDQVRDQELQLAKCNAVIDQHLVEIHRLTGDLEQARDAAESARIASARLQQQMEEGRLELMRVPELREGLENERQALREATSRAAGLEQALNSERELNRDLQRRESEAVAELKILRASRVVRRPTSADTPRLQKSTRR